MDWVEDDDEDDELSDDAEDEDGTDDFDDDFDDFDDDFDDFDDDFDQSSDPESGGDAGTDDDFDDDFGGGGADGGRSDVPERLADFEDRIGELETEVGSISSTMNTVREENKQIGETVDELDDTIRKLLDIYEMVTRGINPFVDDAREMGGLEHGDGAFGLFDSEEEEEDDLDPDVASADAESFFDDDFGELDAEAGEQHAEHAAEDELAEEEPAEPDLDAGADADAAETTSSGGGASFEDLKAEYEDGDGWEDDPAAVDDDPTDAGEEISDDAGAVDEDENGDESDDGDEIGDDEDEDGDEISDDDEDEEAEVETEGVGDEDTDEIQRVDISPDDSPTETVVDEPDESDGAADEPTPPTEATPTVEAAEAVTDDRMFARPDRTTGGGEGRTADGSEPDDVVGRQRLGASPADASDAHLSALPSTYVAESVAMEWMRYLVSTGGLLGASRALRQYQDFGWISADVRRTLDTYVRLAANPDDGHHAPLSVKHHETSLSYVSRLGDRAPDATTLEALATDGGSHDGLRR
jgi:flagellar protein FlaC